MTNEMQEPQKLPTWRQASTLLGAGFVLLVGGCATVFLHGDSSRFRFLDALGGVAYFAGWLLVLIGLVARQRQKRREKKLREKP